MKNEKITFAQKAFQFIFGAMFGISLWGLTLFILLILN